MELGHFMYDLPPALIAPYPSADRAAARLMVLERNSGKISHGEFSSLGTFLRAGDLLVLNDSMVLPVRLRGKKESGGRVEVLLVEPVPGQNNCWIALVDAAKRPRVGTRIYFREGVSVEVMGDLGKGRYGLVLHYEGDFVVKLGEMGEPPLPPYIHRKRKLAPIDWERYQTIYASKPGSIAAPTAGFHFTAELLKELEQGGIDRAFLTLHVGPGTFRPVREQNVDCHRMEAERYSLDGSAAQKIGRAKREGRRVIAVGSTSTRALEGIVSLKGGIEAGQGVTRLFIRPGFSFAVIDGLITNFHLPGSTPLMMVAAFAGLDLVRDAYQEAIRSGYRFYSYGDAMLII